MPDENLQYQPEQRLRKKVCKQAREEQMKDRLLIENCIAACNDAFNNERNGKGDDHFCLRECRLRNMIKRTTITRIPVRQMQIIKNSSKTAEPD